MNDDGLVRLVPTEQAEAVLTLTLFVPGVVEGRTDRYYLARTQPDTSVVESVTVHPDGRITMVITQTSQVDVTECTYADGRTPDGRGCGFGKDVSVEGLAGGEVGVHLAMYWTARDGSRGDLDETVVVPWPGRARKELGAGAWVEAEVRPNGPTPAG